jgi:competence protein ComEC
MQPSRLAEAWRAWLAAERGRFALWLPVGLAAGAVLYFSLRREPPWWSGGAVLLAALGLCWLLRARLLPRAFCAGAAALALGLTLAQAATWQAPGPLELPSRATIVTGTVAAVDVLAEGRRVLLEQPSLNGGPALPRSLRIRLHKGDRQIVATGDHVRVRAMLMPPPPPAYPGGWDLQRDVFYVGIGGFGYALNPFERISEGVPRGIGSWMQRAREAIAARIECALGGGTEAAIATTLLAGAAHGIPEADRVAFRDAGLAHLLAISGLHIGIVMGLFFGLTRFLLVRWEYAALHWPTKQIAALAALAAGGGYMLLTGGHVPILRSFAMACVVTLGVLVGRRALSLRGLGLAMVVVLAVLPEAVMGVSFQMSFAAVLALITGYDALRPWLLRVYGDGSRRRRVLAHVVALVVTSALAGTASAPFGAYHFGHIQVYFILANLVAVPLTAFWVMPAGMLALALMPLHLEALALVPMGWGIEAVLWVAHGVAAWPAAVLAVPHMPAWGLGVLSLGMVWLALWRSRLRLGGVALIALGLISPALDRPPDMLVSDTASLIGVRTDHGVFLQRGARASDFTEQAWLQLWAVTAAVALPGCDGASCVLWRHPEVVLVRGAADASACDAALVVSAEPVQLHCAGPVIDRFTAYRSGAQAVWLGPEGVRVLSDRENRGARPWVIPVPTRTSIPAGLKLTPALAEVLPKD